MSPLASTLLLSLTAALVAALVLWLVSLARRDASLVDRFWGVGFVILAWIAACWNTPLNARVLLLVVLTTVWGLRLSLYLTWRNWGEGEDRRYAAMREQHGRRFWWVSLFTVFLLQAVLQWFVSLPIQIAATRDDAAAWYWLDALGLALWAIGLFFETVGDWQLARFKSKTSNAGKVMDRGLWRYTRHPNYFGDFCVWWGLFLIAASSGAARTIGSPLAMSLLLMKVSGVSLLESTIADRRPDYAAYKARTNAFFPGPPKSSP